MPRRGKVIREITRLIKLTYLQSIQITESDRPAEDFTGVGSDFSGLESALSTIKKEKKRAPYEAVLDTLFPYTADPTRRREQDTGWSVVDIDKEVKWDIAVWRVGVRDVALNSFSFSEVASVVSVPAISPKPIWKITLKTDEIIPPQFDKNQAWILYYISFDEGTNWLRINPLGKPTRFTETGSVVPRIITVNSETPPNDPEFMNIITDEEHTQVRIKITLRRDPTLENSERLSPMLRGYKLLLYPVGGLSGSVPEQVA